MKQIVDYKNLLNPEQIFVAFDIETTGLSAHIDRIVELGGVKYKDGQIIDQFNELINPEMPMPIGASQINGITDKMLVGKPLLNQVLPQFLEFIENAILIAHNAKFDLGFIIKSMSRLGLGALNNDFVDTMPMSQSAFPGRPNYKLQSLAHDLNIKALEAHRAADDARVCLEVFEKCLNTLNPSKQASFF